MAGIAVGGHGIHCFFEKGKHITIHLMSNSISYGEKEREVTYGF